MSIPSPFRGHRVGLALAAGLAISLAACDRESPTASAVRSAGNKLAALSPAGGQPASIAARQKVYTGIKADLQSKLSGGTKSENAAAAVLLAQATNGLAQIPAAAAADLASQNLHDEVEIRATLTRWFTHSALADAAAKYDPAPELAAADADMKKVEDSLAAQQKHKADVDKRVADLRAQAQQISGQAHSIQQQSSEFRAKIPNETAVAGAGLMQQARDSGRKADGLEVQAATLEAQAAQVAPEAPEIQLEIDKLMLQKDMLTQAKAEVQQKVEESHKQATESRKDAKGAADKLDELVKGLLAREEEVKKQTDEAVSQYEAAAASAAKGQTEMKSTAQMSVGSSRQSAADAQWVLAQSYTTIAETLESCANASYATPSAADLKSKAAEARTAAKAALDAASQSYESAFQAYDGAGAKGAAETVMETLKRRISDSHHKVANGSADLMPADTGAAEAAKPGDGGAAPAAAADAGSPQATLQAILDAEKSGHFERVMDLTYVQDESQRKLLGDMLGIAGKFKALDDAMKAKFGAGIPGMAAGMSNAMGGAQDANVSVADIKVQVDGDKATATLPSGKTQVLRKIDGKWLVTPKAEEIQQVTMMAPMVIQMGSAIDQITADINSGKYPDAASAMKAVQEKLMGSMMPGGMPKKPPGGG